MQNNNEFWSKFYKIRYGARIPEERTVAEIAFVESVVPIKKEMKILDFSCGFGRHALALGRKGYDVEGFDIDEGSISEAMAKVKVEGLHNVKLWADSYTRFFSLNKYDLAICMYTSIGFMEEEANTKAFKNLYTAVKVGGFVILDLMNKNWAIENLIPEQEKIVEYQGTTYKIVHSREILKNPWREHNRMKFINQTAEESQESEYELQLYDFNEVLRILNDNGHKLIGAYGDYDRSQLSDSRQRFILVSQRIS